MPAQAMRQLNDIVRKFLRYYHEKRPHQGLRHVPITGSPADSATKNGVIVCRELIEAEFNHAAVVLSTVAGVPVEIEENESELETVGA